MEALETRSSFLVSPEWKNVPFTKHSKVPFQTLLDLLLEGSMILKKVDKLPKVRKEKRVPFLVDMLQDCITLDDKMREFLLDFELFEGGPLFWAVPSKPPVVAEVLYAPAFNDAFSSLSYEFPTVRIGTTMMLYWAALTILWSGACHIYETLEHLTTLSPTADGELEGHFAADGHSHAFQIPLSTRFTAFPSLARNICQSVEFCLRDEMSISSMIAPLNMIIAPLSSWPGLDKEIAWARNMLLDVQNRGIQIIEYLPQTYD
jgi:hypothetical protein